MQLKGGIAALAIMAYLVYALKPPQTETSPSPVQLPAPVRTMELPPTAPVSCADEETSDAEDIFIPFDVPLRVELQAYAAECCEGYDPPVPLEVVIAIAEHESGFRPDAIGHNANRTQDYGLMQINSCALPMLQRELGIRDMDELLDPKQNLRAGIHILAQHAAAFPDSPEAILMAYQYGVAGARDKLSAGIAETDFSRTVAARAEELRKSANKKSSPKVRKR